MDIVLALLILSVAMSLFGELADNATHTSIWSVIFFTVSAFCSLTALSITFSDALKLWRENRQEKRRRERDMSLPMGTRAEDVKELRLHTPSFLERQRSGRGTYQNVETGERFEAGPGTEWECVGQLTSQGFEAQKA